MTDLPERIRIAADRVGGLNRLSEKTGIARRSLGNWLSGSAPKPEALRKISVASGVALDWLLTGEGHPDDEGMTVALRRLSRKAMADQHAEEMKEEDFRDALSKALQKLDAKPNAVTREPDTVAIRRRIVELVRSAHKDARITIRSDDVAVIAMDVFATLTQRVKDLGDAKEVDLVLSHLMHNLGTELAEARAKPGSGKRSASSL